MNRMTFSNPVKSLLMEEMEKTSNVSAGVNCSGPLLGEGVPSEELVWGNHRWCCARLTRTVPLLQHCQASVFVLRAVKKSKFQV